MTRKRFQKLLISTGVPPKKAKNYKFKKNKMSLYAYSIDAGRSWYLGGGKSYQELWNKKAYVSSEWTL